MNPHAALLWSLEDTLVKELLPPPCAEKFAAGALPAEALRSYAEIIKRISGAYIADDADSFTVPVVSNEQEAKAYALYYLPINFAKALYLIERCRLNFDRPLRILDIGCGPGTLTLACLAKGLRDSQVTLLDRSAAMLALAETLCKSRDACGNLFTTRTVLPDAAIEQFDLVLCGNMLGELEPSTALELCGKLVGSLSTHGKLMILEPALQRNTRRLMELRDELLRNFPPLTAIFPCTRGGSCPMLASSEKDWCHGTISWERSRLIRQFDQLTGFNKHRIKLSAAVFENGGSLQSGYRVVSIPEKNRRGFSLTLCGADYYGAVVLPRRARTERNRALGRARVWDRTEMSTLDGEKGEITAHSVVHLMDHSAPHR